MIIDTHCHYNLAPLLTDWTKYWRQAQDHGVAKSIVVGANLISSQAAVDIAATDPNLFAAVGIHPEESQAEDIDDQLTQLQLLAKTPSTPLIAIGEIGLDYYRLSDSKDPVATQQEQQLFAAQIELANQLQLPMIVHVRDRETPETQTSGNAYWDALQMIKVQFKQRNSLIMHCASGPLSYIQQAVDLGAYIGMAANVTYKKADHLQQLARLIPPDRLLFETDAPFLPPQAFRGQTCEPWMITQTADFLTANFNFSLTQVYQNSLTCFQLPH